MARRYANPQEVDLVRSLIGLGLNNCQISRATGVSVPSVARWRRKPLSWLRNREGATGPAFGARCPRCHGRALLADAYSYLLGLYLGDGTIVHIRRGVYRLEVVMDRRYEEIIAECVRAMSVIRSDGCKAGTRKRPGCVHVSAYWKHWPCVFPQHGLGRKHLRPIKLEPWQREIVEKDPRPFLRGLIHSDGCRPDRIRGKYVYPGYQFSNRSDDIRGLFCWGCDLLGVSWSRSNRWIISVSKKESVAALDRFIGPKK